MKRIVKERKDEVINVETAVDEYLSDKQNKTIYLNENGWEYILVSNPTGTRYNFIDMGLHDLRGYSFKRKELEDVITFLVNDGLRVFLLLNQEAYRRVLEEGEISLSDAKKVGEHDTISFERAYKKWDKLNSKYVVAGRDETGAWCVLSAVPSGDVFLELGGHAFWGNPDWDRGELKNVFTFYFDSLFLFENYKEMSDYYRDEVLK